MRILDVGCSDGAILHWLQGQVEGLDCYGIESDPKAVTVANRRGINTVIGTAEEAPELFEGNSFDIVTSFEVIEHVADVDAYLTALEAMVKPGGTVMLSTPEGTFGEGSNPNHLRVFRAKDLADLLRHRGQLIDIMVGSDNVTVASYTPSERKGEIAINTGPNWMRWSPTDILSKGLGGSETAAVRLAEALSALGYVVTVYGEVDECAYRDVMFADWRTFDPLDERLAVISSRMPEVVDRPLRTPNRMLWMHDTDAQDRLTAARASRVDHILALSKWHAEHIGGMYPFARKKIRQIRNGVALDLFTDSPEREQRVLYTSSPDRGLDILLELWPQVRKQVPKAKLCAMYAPVYNEVAKSRPEVRAHWEKIEKLADQPGVELLPPQSQPALARLMLSSMVWAHPSYATPYEGVFHETSCIGAMEAQAAGLHVVASDWGALRETVKVGALINNGPLTKKWKDGFVKEIVRGLIDPECQVHAQTEGPKAAESLGWDGVAKMVEGLIEGEIVGG